MSTTFTSLVLTPDRVNIVDMGDAYEDTVITGETLNTGTGGKRREYLRYALVHFPMSDIPQALFSKQVAFIYFEIYLFKFVYPPDPSKTSTEHINILAEDFTSTVTYNTRPADWGHDMLSIAPDVNVDSYWFSNTAFIEKTAVGQRFESIDAVRNVLQHGIRIWGSYDYYTSLTTNPIKLRISFINEDDFTITGSPNGGSIIKQKANEFNWAVTLNTQTTLEPVTITGNTFEWRADAESTATVINTGMAQTYTVPANTFSTDSVQWRATATLSNGDSISTDWYTLSTVEPPGEVWVLRPENSIEDGSNPILFQWRYYNSSGLPPTGADLQWGPPNSTFQDLAHIDGPNRYYYVPADTFPPGTIYWRVRAYNQEGRVGGWSASVTFLNVAAPVAPVVTSDSKPYTTLSWQAEGQQAYRITIDGTDYGTKFGTDMVYTLPEPLPDGQYTASVSVQGIYGLWSNPGSVTFTVANSATGSIDLIGGFNNDVGLLWTSTETGGVFYIYRDGSQIAHTEENSYLDRTVLGEHTYFVRQRFANGTYIDSNTVTGTATVEEPQIALLSGGPWLSLRLSERSDSQQTFRYSKIHSLRHITAAEYPYLELSNYADETGEYDASFVSAEEAKPLLDMRGQVVILKSRGNKVIIGPLAEVRTVYRDFYVSCTFSIQRITWEGFANADS